MRALFASCALSLLLAAPLAAAERQVFSVLLGAGQSPMNSRGQSSFRTITFELTGRSERLDRWLPNTEMGASISYSKIRQARSWFGYQFGEPDDRVRAENAFLFLRHQWRVASSTWRPYAELGTGPMWSNRRVPAATSRLNFDSQFGAGLILGPGTRTPWRIGYRFQHISNGGLTGRNPGLNVHSFLVGARVKDLRH